MESRKVQEVKGSFYVYLPKEWCVKAKIKGGSQVNFQELKDGSLVIFSSKEEYKRKLNGTLNIENCEPHMAHVMLVAGYMVGLDQMNLVSTKEISLEFREYIESAVRAMIGIEVVDETDKSISIKDISEVSSIKPIIQRLLNTTGYILNSVVRIIGNGDPKESQVIINRDDDVDRYHWLVQRMVHLTLENPTLAKELNILPIEGLHYSHITRYIERIADHAVGIAEQILANGTANEELSKLAEKANNLYSSLISVLFSRDLSKAFDILDQRNILKKEIRILETEFPESKVIIIHLERIIDYCSDISETAIDQALYEAILKGKTIKCEQ
ncbi:MAG: PhoU domain-containing protein [Candidatus Freyarchaeum deiterrae]